MKPRSRRAPTGWDQRHEEGEKRGVFTEGNVMPEGSVILILTLILILILILMTLPC